MSAMLEVAIDARRADEDNVVPLRAAGEAPTSAADHDRAGAGPDERAIAAALVAGRPAALEAAFRNWADLVHGVARQLVGRAEADDVTQQVFVAAWQSRTGFDPDRGEVPGWLVGITRNVARTHLRRRAPDPVELVDTLDADTSAPSQDDVVDALLVASALRDLPDDQRRVLELTMLEDLTQAEAAVRLDLPLGTVKTHQRRGLRRLRASIGGRHDA